MSMSDADYGEKDKKEDLKVLHSMGYAQELERSMSSFSNFAISFSIICILSGGINSLGQATAGVSSPECLRLHWLRSVRRIQLLVVCITGVPSSVTVLRAGCRLG